jgi:hypothetical protein
VVLRGFNPPVRAIIIRDFILKCKEKKLKLCYSKTVYDETKNKRFLIRKELIQKGLPIYDITRVLSAAELKVKEFLEKIELKENLSASKLFEVKQFFKKHSTDEKLIELKKKKEILGQNVSVMPGENDLKILSEALNLTGLFFVTTDEHYYVLISELENEFGFIIVCPDNSNKKLREWNWN